jgi:hypothetical protein
MYRLLLITRPPPSNAEVKNAWSYTSTSQYAFMVRDAQLKHRGNITFTFIDFSFL